MASLHCADEWSQQIIAHFGFGLDPFGISDFGAVGYGVIKTTWDVVNDGSIANLSAIWRRRTLQVRPFGRGPAGAQPYGGKAKAYGLGSLPWTEGM